jgi:hypothetical protein
VITGLYNQGRYPSYNWIEIMNFSPEVNLGPNKKSLDIDTDGPGRQLFQHLADLIPPGGHMMIEYDSPEQKSTARSLAQGIPSAATPLGYMLFSIGCGASFKDWHFAEGGSEGSRKLQGYKPLNRQHAQLKIQETVGELKNFLSRPPSMPDSELEQAARRRALKIIRRHEKTGGPPLESS